MAQELYKYYRPKTLKEVLGQPEAIKILQGFVDTKSVPHTMLFTGPSGCGKTTLARILSVLVGSNEDNTEEVNAAEKRGIDDVREIQSKMRMSALGCDARVYIIDEAHNLTKDAQTAFLKNLEDTPKHVYFFLCTTDPEKLLPTIISRSTEIKVRPLSEELCEDLIAKIINAEGMEPLSENVQKTLIEVAEGSPRKLLVLLQPLFEIPTEQDRLVYLIQNSSKRSIDELFKMLVFERPSWTEVANFIKTVEESDWEKFRRRVLAVATTMALKQPQSHARWYLILNSFCDDWYASGKAGFVRSCMEVCARAAK